MARIELENVGLRFWVTPNGALSSRERLRWLLTRRRPPSVVEVAALDGIDLRLDDGDRIGLIGHNGAGKSTMLKVLADVYPPTSGRCRVVGSISALFDFALGFEVDATGWENIAYRAYLLGESSSGLRAKKEAVAEFSELGSYLDLPVRYLSSGMRVRLAFSIATAVRPDILLIDEAFNAGDLPFRLKAKARIREMMTDARIVVSVSHELDLLAEMCDRILWLDHGRIREAGPARAVIERYTAEVSRRPATAAA